MRIYPPTSIQFMVDFINWKRMRKLKSVKEKKAFIPQGIREILKKTNMIE